MKCLERNRSAFWYALYAGKEPVTDEYGNDTGEWRTLYGKPQKYQGNISAAKGELQTQQFGENERYDKVIVLDSRAPAMDEYSILWVDCTPVLSEDGTTDTPHDYIVKKVAKSLNHVALAVQKVDVA